MKHLHATRLLLLAAALVSVPASAVDPEATQWTGIFTGRRVDGAPVYRLPAITIIADRKTVATAVPVYRLPAMTVIADRKPRTPGAERNLPQVEQEARAKPAKPRA